MVPGSDPGHDPLLSSASKMTFETPPDFLEAFLASKPFKELLKRVRGPGDPPVVGGVTGMLFSMLAAGLRAREARPILVLLSDDAEAAGVAMDLDLLGHKPLWFPAGAEGFSGRMRALQQIGKVTNPFVVAPLRAVLDPVPGTGDLDRLSLTIEKGAALDRDAFLERLVAAGYRAEAIVDRGGFFSVRGDLVDVFFHDRPRPVRIEFFDDEVEDLRAFDPATQLAVEKIESLTTLLAAPEEERFSSSFADHLGDDALVVTREVIAMEEALARHLERLDGAAREQCEASWRAIEQRPTLRASRLKAAGDEAAALGGMVVAPEGTALDQAFSTLERVARGKRATLVCFDTEAERDRFIDALEEDALRPDSSRRNLRKKLVPHVGGLSTGFHSPLLGIGMVAHRELFATPLQRRPRDPSAVEEELVTHAIEHFLDLDPGDYVVHLTRGIARFDGLETVEKAGGRQDFLRLVFRDEIALLVPAARIELVQKYIGGKGEAPELSKLGGASWEKRKAAVERGIGDLAADLLELQALRMKRSGIQHAPDTAWQQEFEAAFPHQLTLDQGRAVEAIKTDMESARPMDRLLCGDVGYGKTEVAMRAAFKAVMGERQVAVLVPTTVLAQQHLESFRERMSDYPMVIEGLSRFRTAKQTKATVEAVAAGEVDIVIGTHRLVSSDVTFQNLGLVIVDEEQRFGVKHKERLRQLRSDVDVLTLSATPIPRTLHQALVGIRDISPLQQAPSGRRSVESEVTEYDEGLIRRAILRELDRGGQVYFVHNRVQTIQKVAKRIQDLVPDARILVGHGQMPERALEKTMTAFVEQEADILIATTIIESGLDIPSANTIFVDQAELYGLSDLHQLRGRVGRHHRQAYAYFLVRPDRALSEIGMKRLKAIEEFSRLGAGFQISMRDMEIRGAGNILGSEQSGHIAAIGYDLYCRLLDRAVRRLKKEDVPDLEEAEMDLDVTAYLPEGYVPDAKQRIELYRKFGRARTEADFRLLSEELRDRYGRVPDVVHEFGVVARIRALLERAGIRRLKVVEGEGLFLDPGRKKPSFPGIAPSDVRKLSNGQILLARSFRFSGPLEIWTWLAQALGDMKTMQEAMAGSMGAADGGAVVPGGIDAATDPEVPS